MNSVISKDGTQIAYDRLGKGPAVILVDGALGYRSFGFSPELAGLLAPYFTVYSYDRRGRGESGDTHPYSVEREVEDIEALIDAAGGSAYLFGISSGAALALEAAIQLGDNVKKLALYDPAYNPSPGASQAWKAYRWKLDELLSTGRRGDAVALFMQYVGAPVDIIEGMRQAPVWPMLEAEAPTLAYDAAVIGEDQSVPTERAATVTAATLVMNGDKGMPFMKDTAEKLAKAIPYAKHHTLEGQGHDVSPQALVPVLVEFFNE